MIICFSTAGLIEQYLLTNALPAESGLLNQGHISKPFYMPIFHKQHASINIVTYARSVAQTAPVLNAGESSGHVLHYKTKKKAWQLSHKSEKQISKTAERKNERYFSLVDVTFKFWTPVWCNA